MENLKSFLDGELDLAGKAEVETHLRQDAELAKMSADFSALTGALKGVDPGVPYGMDQLQSRLSTASVAESKKIWRFAGWSSILGLLLVVAMIPGLKRGGSSRATYSTAETGALSKDMMKGADSATPATPMASEGAPAGSIAPAPMSEAKPELEQSQAKSVPLSDGFVNGSEQANKSGDYADMERGGGTWPIRGRISADSTLKRAQSLLPAEDKAKLDMSIGKNTPGAPYGVYLEKSGTVAIEVEDLARTVDEATGMVTSLKGFVVTSDMQNTVDGGLAHMTLRVPSDNFPAAMNRLQAMGEVKQVNSASQDITGETVSSAAKTRSWADQEKQLIEELAKSRNRDEKWRIRAELSNVRANLEAEKWQLNNLKERGNFSTIQATFSRGGASSGSGGWAKGAFGDAKNGLGSIGQILGTIGIYFLVFIPVWLPLAIAGWMVTRRRR